MNMFIRPIYEKKKFDLIGRFKFHRYIKKLSNIAPSFEVLSDISDFVKILEIVYMYDNSNTQELFTGHTKLKSNENGFYLKHDTHMVMILLDNNTKEISIEIEKISTKKTQTNIIFVDGDQSIVKNIHDEHLFINLNKWIMRAVIDLMKKYYKMYKP